MSVRHITKRGSHYHYVCRIPNDLQHHFPNPVIWKSLKSSDKKYASILATAWEYKTQQLFMQLRSGMLDTHLINHLLTLYLGAGVANLEARAYDRNHKTGKIETMLDLKNDLMDSIEKAIGHAGYADLSSLGAERLRERIQSKSPSVVDLYTDQLTDIAKEKYNVSLSGKEKSELGIRVMQCEKQLHEIDSAIKRGDLTPLELLKEKVESAKPYSDLKMVIGKYQEWFVAAKPDIKPGTRSDMEIECALLLEVFGNISIDLFNSMDSITRLKKVLGKYPKNRFQRFGPYSQRSITHILRNEEGYDVISHKTANEYIKRAKSLVDYAIKSDLHEKTNKWARETFSVVIAEEDKRQAYDQDDIERLVDALCTQDLWRYNPPKPERFWIIMIALFHGLRLSNITGLNKKDICLTKSDIWVIRVRFGKRKATVKDYPIHDCLLLLGFLEWIEQLDRPNLFQDDSSQISRWWNRVDRDETGNIVSGGFEYMYITKDPTKCLYSLRHHYAGEVYNASQDYKATAEALGHSLGGKVTNGYIGKIRTKTHKQLTDKLQFDVDLNMLEARAQMLFNLKLS